MSQTRKSSLIEAVVNTAVGFGISLISQLAIFSAYGVTLPLADNVLITCWFTVISIARGYLLRRWFNARGRAPVAADSGWKPPHRNPSAPAARWSDLPPRPCPPPPRVILEGRRVLTPDEAAEGARERFDRESA